MARWNVVRLERTASGTKNRLSANEIAAAPGPYSGRVRAYFLKLIISTHVHGKPVGASREAFPHC